MQPKRIVLAYSGGLDTSIILVWLRETFGAEVITFTADIGQGEEVEAAREKALACGAAKAHVEDLREAFVRDYVFSMFRAAAIYEGEYLLGTSIARPLIAKRMVEIARAEGADALAHGATGKGNDQVRFELAFAALAPEMQVIAPWRIWDFRSREQMLAYAEQHGIPVERRGTAPPFSMDANLLHISYEGGPLEDPWQAPPSDMWRWTRAPEEAPDEPEEITIAFERGDPVAINGKRLSPAELLARLNELGARHGIGRVDIVENRFVGIKSRGCYETPGGTILFRARRAMESITLDREAMHLRDELAPRYAKLVYNGFWFAPEREALQRLVDAIARDVEGEVRLKLYKGQVYVLGRRSPRSLYAPELSTFEDDQGAYNQKDAEGFIRLQALRLATAAKKRGALG